MKTTTTNVDLDVRPNPSRWNVMTREQHGYGQGDLRMWVVTVNIIALVAVIFGGIGLVTFLFFSHSGMVSCRTEGRTMGYAWNWQGGNSQTCFLKVNGKYVPDTAFVLNKGN